MAEFYSKELSQKVTRGLRESALKGNSTGGNLSLGYKLQDHKLVPDPNTAHIVQEAFQLYSEGVSVAEICRTFNEKGYRTKRGFLFNKNSFTAIFSNRKYIGEYKYMDVIIPNGVPALVSEDLFYKVQKRLKTLAPATKRARVSTNYLLSQKLFCGHCGGLMIGVTSTSHTGRKYHYYACNASRVHKCDKKVIGKDEIEYAVTEDLLRYLTPEMVELIATMVMNVIEEENKKDDLVPMYERVVQEKERAIENLLKLVEQGVPVKNIASRLETLEEEKAEAIEKLHYYKERRVPAPVEKEQVMWFLSRHLKGNPEDPSVQEHVIETFVKKITVWDIPGGGYRLKYECYLSDGQNIVKTEKSVDISDACRLSDDVGEDGKCPKNVAKTGKNAQKHSKNTPKNEGAFAKRLVDVRRVELLC